MVNFLKKFYSFSGSNDVSDEKERIHIELMIYTHIWESTPLLKSLFRLAHVSSGCEYPWKISIPEMGKHEFIRNTIRPAFENSNIPKVIRNGFHTSLRNAFAHSEYYFDIFGKDIIILDNYKGKEWELSNISFNNWSKRFVYSVLLSYNLLDLKFKNRHSLISEHKTNRYLIRCPSKSGLITNEYISYNETKDNFFFL